MEVTDGSVLLAVSGSMLTVSCFDNLSEICLSQDDLLILNFTVAWGVHYALPFHLSLRFD